MLVHEKGHLWMSRRLLGRTSGGNHEIVLWPLGGYTFCDGLARRSVPQEDEDEAGPRRGDLKDDIKIALAGELIYFCILCIYYYV